MYTHHLSVCVIGWLVYLSNGAYWFPPATSLLNAALLDHLVLTVNKHEHEFQRQNKIDIGCSIGQNLLLYLPLSLQICVVVVAKLCFENCYAALESLKYLLVDT